MNTNVKVNISDNRRVALESGNVVSIHLGFQDLCGEDILSQKHKQIEWLKPIKTVKGWQ